MARCGNTCAAVTPAARLHGERTLSIAGQTDGGKSPKRQTAGEGSTVRLRNLESGIEATYVLIRPESACAPQNGLSVRFPLGRALLGKRVGETFVYRSAGGPARIQIKALQRARGFLADATPEPRKPQTAPA
jgi:transcription elongation GreA/GreB family factor